VIANMLKLLPPQIPFESNLKNLKMISTVMGIYLQQALSQHRHVAKFGISSPVVNFIIGSPATLPTETRG